MISRKNKSVRNKTLKISRNKNLHQTIINKFLEVLNCVKIYHWSTQSYSQHKATDELYLELNKYIDEFVEIMLGKTKHRIKYMKIKSHKINNKKKFVAIMNEFKTFLISLNKNLHHIIDSNLINIRDEMLGIVDRILYLFELK